MKKKRVAGLLLDAAVTGKIRNRRARRTKKYYQGLGGLLIGGAVLIFALLQGGTPSSRPRPTATQNAVVNIEVTRINRETLYVQRDTVIRECPQSTCESIGTLRSGSRVIVDASADDQVAGFWYRTSVNDQRGFVYSSFLGSSMPKPTLVATVTPISRAVQATREFVCPSNCTDAVAMGLTARQAASCGLDRDGDGVACYGD